MIERPRDKTGDRYEYFTCTGRRRKKTSCTRSAIHAPRIEQRIEATYGSNGLTDAEADRVRSVTRPAATARASCRSPDGSR